MLKNNVPGIDSPVPYTERTANDVVSTHVFLSTPARILNDPVAVLAKMLLRTSDSVAKRNIQAAIDTTSNGQVIRPDQIFANGRLVEFQEWRPEMGAPFSPFSHQQMQFATYNEVPYTIAWHKLFFQIRLHPFLDVPPLVFTVEVLWDTGSDFLTLYNRDIEKLDPWGVYPRTPRTTIRTANGPVKREGLIVAARLLKADLSTAVGGWFNEEAVISPDEIIVDEKGLPLEDVRGKMCYIDNRLSGRWFRRQMFYGSSKHDDRLIFSTNKAGLVTHIIAK